MIKQGADTYISIHVLREEDDMVGCDSYAEPETTISIHVLREEDDTGWYHRSPKRYKFQSTSSVRRTTYWFGLLWVRVEISIHVLREEDDSKSTQKTCASFAQRVQSFPRRAA